MDEVVKAIRMGDAERLRALLEENPALARQANVLGITPLHEAVDQERLEIIEILLDSEADIDAKDKYGHTPLFRAAWQGSEGVVDLLVNRGADINTRDQAGHSLLHWVAFQGHLRMLQMLLDRGAEVDACNVEGRTPLDYAGDRGHYEAVDLLAQARQRGELARRKKALKYATIGEAIDQGDLEGVREHLKFAEDFYPNRLFDHALLLRAASRGYQEILDLLLEKGADVNVQGSYGVTPLHIAAAEGRKEVVEDLVAKGADVTLTDFENKTPVQLAREKGHAALAKWLAAQRPRPSTELPREG